MIGMLTVKVLAFMEEIHRFLAEIFDQNSKTLRKLDELSNSIDKLTNKRDS
jgi:predicted translin family RNA/ssDNA-binding protein